MAKRTRLQDLQDAAAGKGKFVRTYSPGDGVTRYRFFDAKKSDQKAQSYFGPDDGEFTALGLKEAFAYLGKTQSRPRRHRY